MYTSDVLTLPDASGQNGQGVELLHIYLPVKQTFVRKKAPETLDSPWTSQGQNIITPQLGACAAVRVASVTELATARVEQKHSHH